MQLPEFLIEKYEVLKIDINKRLDDFASVSESEYFYELCFCICTPQSRAKNALQVIDKLKMKDFLSSPFNPANILGDRAHYIRFHNTKGKRILDAAKYFPKIKEILSSGKSGEAKRLDVLRIVNGFGLKESSHFLRNIGYRNLAILDRHILKHLVHCEVIKEVPKAMTFNLYLNIEESFIDFANNINISMDELDLLFWSYETGEILK